jgi:hypothetical protein
MKPAAEIVLRQAELLEDYFVEINFNRTIWIMGDLNELLYGKEFNDKLEEFKDNLEKIEQANFDWFKERKPKYESEPHDKLYHHYLIRWDSNGIGFGFHRDSEVPAYIQLECHDLFKKYFPDKPRG